tara:strand:+ start:771 stop:1460 length:690 start_codon:yes stop_codon:yes gene_type:complete
MSAYSKLAKQFGCDSYMLTAFKLHYDKLKDTLTEDQLNSKLWLLDKIKRIDLGTVFICAGWYGVLATMMFEDENIYVDKIRSFDIDDSCWRIAEELNEPWKADNWMFKATTLDIVSFFSYIKHESSNVKGEYHYYTTTVNNKPKLINDIPDTFINTSCEHIEKFTDWFNAIPKGKLVALQTNNYFNLPEHVNCVKDINQFKQQAPLNNIIYEGSLELEKYTRYMLIGYM